MLTWFSFRSFRVMYKYFLTPQSLIDALKQATSSSYFFFKVAFVLEQIIFELKSLNSLYTGLNVWSLFGAANAVYLFPHLAVQYREFLHLPLCY